MLMCKLLQCPRLDLILKYPHLCVNFIVIFNNRIIIYKFLQLKFHNNTLQNLSHDVQISRGEMTLSRVLARQNDGPQIMINSYFVTAVSLIEQNPELGFAASVWAWPRFLLQSFVISVAEESYHVIRSGQSDSMTNGALQICFADSHEHYLEFVLMFGLIRSQNKCGIYHFRIVSPHSSSFTRCLIFPGPREAAVSNDSALRPKYVLFTKYSEHPNIFMVIPTHPPLTNKHRTFSGW